LKSYDKTLTRLILILTKLSNNERPTTRELSDEFGIGIRTIQRDIYERLLYFPIEKDSEDRLKFIDGFSLDKSTLDNDEMMLVWHFTCMPSPSLTAGTSMRVVSRLK
jgi:predicted DNA-binding transcriptional regulator YafY